MSNREDKYEDDYGSVGDAREECSSGRSKGTPATRPTKIYKESLKYRRPMLLGTANIDGRPKNRKPYKIYSLFVSSFLNYAFAKVPHFHFCN